MDLKEFNHAVLQLIGKGPCKFLDEALKDYYWETRYNNIEREYESAKAAEKFIKQLEAIL